MSIKTLIQNSTSDIEAVVNESVVDTVIFGDDAVSIDVAQSNDALISISTDSTNIVQMAVTQEVPNVTYNQQFYVTSPYATYNSPGVASYFREHFRIINGEIRLNDDIISGTDAILQVDELPTEDMSLNAIYAVGNKFYIYVEDINNWVRINQSIDTVDSYGNIVDAGKVYYFTGDNEHPAGYYVCTDGTIEQLVLVKDFNDVRDIATEALNKSNTAMSEIDILRGKLDDLLYEPIKINSFTVSPQTVDKGRVLTTLTFNWSFSKIPKTLSFTGTDDVNSTGIKLTDLELSSNRTYTLSVTDERDTLKQSSITVRFYNRVYYGVAKEPESYDSEFIKSLNSQLVSSTNIVTSFNVNAGEGDYIYYCLPVENGECLFYLGVQLPGGMKELPEVSFANAYNYGPVQYRIYKSDYSNLGSFKIDIVKK